MLSLSFMFNLLFPLPRVENISCRTLRAAKKVPSVSKLEEVQALLHERIKSDEVLGRVCRADEEQEHPGCLHPFSTRGVMAMERPRV